MTASLYEWRYFTILLCLCAGRVLCARVCLVVMHGLRQKYIDTYLAFKRHKLTNLNYGAVPRKKKLELRIYEPEVISCFMCSVQLLFLYVLLLWLKVGTRMQARVFSDPTSFRLTMIWVNRVHTNGIVHSFGIKPRA